MNSIFKVLSLLPQFYVCTLILLTSLRSNCSYFSHAQYHPFHRQYLATMMRLSATKFRVLPQLGRQFARTLCVPAAPGKGPNHRSVMALDENTIRPIIQPNAYVAPDATVIGSVTINDKSALLSNATVRGDLGLIEIGVCCVIGEGATLEAKGNASIMTPKEATDAGLPLAPDVSVGDFCRVGSGAVLSSCTLDGDNVVGNNSVIGQRVVLRRGARVLDRSVVADDVEIGENEVWAGNPAVKVDTLSAPAVDQHTKNMVQTYNTTKRHAFEFLPIGSVYWEKEALAKVNAS